MTRETDYLGAELSIDVQKEFFEISLETLRRNMDPAYDIFADVILRPAFDSKEWPRVKALALNDVVQRREEPREVARVVSERVIYGDAHPYGHPVDGYEGTVKGIELEDVKQFYAWHFRPESAILLASGDITIDELMQRVEAKFGAWESAEGAPLPVQKPSPEGNAKPRLIIVDKPEAPQTEVRVLVPAPEFSSARMAPLFLANTVLGGTFTSRLVSNLREKNGFTYGASSVVALRSAPAHVIAASPVHTDKTGPALSELCKEFRGKASGKFEPNELAKSLSTHRSRLVEALEAQDTTLGIFKLSAALGKPPEERRDFYKELEKTAAAQISIEAAETYRWDLATLVLVGDRKAIEDQLGELKANPPRDLDGKPCTFPEPEIRGRDGETLAQ